MSKGQTLAKLEALLARVRTRAVEPRAARVVVAAPPAFEPPALEASVAAPVSPPPPPAVAQPVFELDEPVEDLESTQSRAAPSRPAPTQTESDIVVEVEVQATTQETVVAVPVEEAQAPAALESRERLVAAEPAPALAGEAVAIAEPEIEPSPVVALSIDEAVDELVPDLAPDVEAVPKEDEAPVSSRRPVAPPPEERLDEMAFGSVEPEPPRHTPPPESGRLPAAPEVEFEGDITGVRDASRSAQPVAAAPDVAIVPEATLADLAPSDQVADVVSPAHAREPATFVSVLDQSLAL